MISVICPIYNEERYIGKCIESIMRQDYPKEDMEVLFVDGMSTDRTRAIIAGYLPQCPYVRILDNPKRIVPYAMNKGIEEARGEVIIRIDAHTYYERNYFSALVRRLYELGADDVGAVCKTDVLNKTPKTLAIKEVLSNKFGVGNSVFRTGVDKVMEVDTVPFGCWRREVFEKYGMYDTRLVRNQDIELSKRILRGGGKIFIVPDTFCTYLARETFKGLARNNFQNGKWNILTVYFTRQFDSLSLRHFVPMIFVLSLVLPVLGGVFYAPLAWLAVLSLGMYLLALSVVSCQLAAKKSLNVFYLLCSFFVLHFSYGCGSIAGLWKVFCLKVNGK